MLFHIYGYSIFLGAEKCQGVYCGSQCKQFQCAWSCGFDQEYDSAYCGEHCNGEECSL